MRPSEAQFSIRRLIVVVAAIALTLGALRFVYSMLSFEPRYVQDPDFMSQLCRIEADFMESRRVACLGRAKANTPWDSFDEETEDLKIRPFPSDDAPCSSWSEQAEVWGRASAKCAEAVAWHGRTWWNGWTRSRPAPFRP